MSGPQDVFDALRKVVGDKPLYFVAGASDLVNEKLRELPETLNSLQSEYKEFPMRAAGAVVGQFFRANLRVGEIYDDLTRRGEEVVAKMRGEEVVAEEDEPFVREPFLPEPVHASPPPVVQAEKAPERKASAPKKGSASSAPARKTAPAKKQAKETAAKSTSTAKAPTVKAPAKRRAPSRRPTTQL